MASGLELILVAITVLIAYVFWSRRNPKNFPPGPVGLPIVGCMFSIDKCSHKYYKELSKKYASNVISIKLGTRDVVVLNDWKSIQDILYKQSELFSGRPFMFLWDKALEGIDIFTSYGPLWKERKRFILHQLRDIGVGKHSMEEVIMEEVKKTMVLVEESSNDRKDVTSLYFQPLFNIMTKIIAGFMFEVDDMALKKLRDAIHFNSDFFKNDSPLNFLAYLRHVPGLTNLKAFVESYRDVDKLLQTAIDEHLKTYVEGNTRDFIDIFIRQILKNKDKKSSENAFKPENLPKIIYNLYHAGLETTTGTLGFALLYMATWPEIQSKVQAELDQLLGNGRLPTYSDRKLLPYTEATILELLRYSSTVPLSVPHAPVATAQLCGYTIPKGTMVIANMWAIHNDVELWGDPEVFRPERFLDANGKVQKPEYFIPFSIGARFCPGEPLARMEIFLIFTSMMQRFSFRCITGEAPPSLEPITGVTQRPQPFSLLMKPRKQVTW